MSIIADPGVVIADQVKEQLLAAVDEEKQITVHITYRIRMVGDGIRIWPTTYLVPQEGGTKSSLITCHNISMAPFWTFPEKRGDYRFTLIFSMLPSSCRLFHLWEDIEQPLPFIIRNIPRNKSDVYELRLNAI